jgi:hypothetical protein
MAGHRVEASRYVALAPEAAYDRLLATPLPEIFCRRYAAFPAISAVPDQPADWGILGQVRTIELADGGRIRETLTIVERPHRFGYVLDDIQGALRPFVRTVDGEWSVTPEGEGSRIGWTWTLHPKRSPARLTMSVIGRMWKGYADRALAEIDRILTDRR